MNTRSRILAAFILFNLGAVSRSQTPQSPQLYPEIEPFRTGMLKVSDIHQLYYELNGNPDGAPVITLHGGPGGGSYPTLRRYHDPKKYLIVLFDQRGAGKSKPYSELRDNNTAALVEDVEKLRKELNLGKVQLFGGSWGSTLALAYAEKYPQNVSSMILRGVFTATKGELDHFYHGGTAVQFPDVYERLQRIVPRPDVKSYPQQLLEILQGKDEAKKKEVARAWAAYETRCSGIDISDAKVQSLVDSGDPYPFALIENYYMANNCFLEEGQLLRGASKIADIPTVIVQGRFDVICPPSTAFRLYKALPKSKLVFVEDTGHSGGAPPMISALVDAVKWLEANTGKR